MSGAQPADRRTAVLLATCARAVARGGDLDATLRQIVEAGTVAFDAAAGAVFLLDHDLGTLSLSVRTDDPHDSSDRSAIALDDDSSPVARAVRERSLVRLAPGERTAGVLGPGWGSAGGLLVPLVVGRDGIDLALGVVAFGWLSGGPSEDAVMLAGSVADLAAAAVDRAILGSLATERSEWFDRLAHTDPLTGLANRRTFDRMLELELARASRQGGEVTVAVFDVDGFAAARKAVGGAAGDDILRSVAAVLAESVRLVDTVARYGGDAFVLVAPGAAGTVVADRVVQGVMRLPAEAGKSVSISGGVAHFPVDGTNSDELLAAAETALAAARAEGGGRVSSASAPVA